MKNHAEMNNYGALLIRDEQHENFYRTMQNDDATDFDDSFLYTPQLQCEKAIYAKRINKEASLMTENDVHSDNYAVQASKREKMEKHEFRREKPAESTKTIHKTIKDDATTDFIERTKENDRKLIEIRDFEVYGVNDGAMVFVSNEKFFEESDDVDDADISPNVLSLDWTSGPKYLDGIQKPTDDAEKEFEKFVKVRWKPDNYATEVMMKLMTKLRLRMTVNFLQKTIMWTKATVKRTQRHAIFATGRVLEGVAHIPCTPWY